VIQPPKAISYQFCLEQTGLVQARDLVTTTNLKNVRLTPKFNAVVLVAVVGQMGNVGYSVLRDDVFQHQLRHLEHADLLFAEYSLQGCVCIDHRLHLFVLQSIFLDVLPELLGQFSAG